MELQLKGKVIAAVKEFIRARNKRKPGSGTNHTQRFNRRFYYCGFPIIKNF